MIVLDVILMVGIAAVTVGFLIWAICTQHRDPGSADLRIRRLQVNVSLPKLDQPEAPPASTIAL
jgi:hypothetical protein